MSMTKQLWSAIVVSMLLALCGSLLASMLSARGYLTEQLTMKNTDNANALALSLSQAGVDNVRIELAVAALFDGGQYQLIRVTDPHGRIIVEKKASPGIPDAPFWFVSLLPIEAEAGIAQINNGWKQFGTIILQSETRFAYRSLWLSAMQMVTALALSCLVAGYLGSLIMRRLLPPLREVVNQAKGITERRFTTIAVPKVPELANLARAMNLMVSRLQAMFEQEAERLETVRREANFDTVTGLANRSFFMAQLAQTLPQSSSGGVLVLLRINGLADINHRLGRVATDEMLKAVAAEVTAFAAETSAKLTGRLSGADFSLLLNGQDSEKLKILLGSVMTMAPRFEIDPEHFVHIGSISFPEETETSIALAQADAALATAEANGRSNLVRQEINTQARHPRSAAEWDKTLRSALAQKQIRLEQFPIADMDGHIVAFECPLRMRFDDASTWHPASQFVPVAERLCMTSTLDLAAIALGIEALESSTLTGNIALNLSPQSVADAGFRRQLLALISRHRHLAKNLWLEVAESGALLHLDDLASLCRDLAPMGCRVGIEHFGHEFSQIGRLHQIGLHYLKMDNSFIKGIESNLGNQAFLRGVRSITRASGLQLHAEGVSNEAELKQLSEIGFDAATGPAIRVS